MATATHYTAIFNDRPAARTFKKNATDCHALVDGNRVWSCPAGYVVRISWDGTEPALKLLALRATKVYESRTGRCL